MHETLWGDDRLRTFITALRDSSFLEPVDDVERSAFIREARRRVVPVVQQRILAEIGAAIDAAGTAELVFAVLDRESWGRPYARLMVSPRPWDLIVELAAKEIASAYRTSTAKRDRRILDRVAKKEGGPAAE